VKLKTIPLLLLSAAFMLVLRLRPLKLRSLLAVGLGALLYALAGTSVALAGHHPEPGTGGGDASLLLFMVGMVAVGVAGFVSYLVWNKRRRRSLRRGQQSSRRRRG